MTRALAALAIFASLAAAADARADVPPPPAKPARSDAAPATTQSAPASVAPAAVEPTPPSPKRKPAQVAAPLPPERKRSIVVVPPLYAHWKTADHASRGFIIGPLGQERDNRGSTTALFPLYWHFHDRQHDAHTGFLFPIAGFHTHTGARGAFVGPVYGWSSHNSDGWGAGLAPILMFGRTGARSHVMLLPLFAHVADRAAGSQTTAVGPLFVRTTRDGGDGGLLPILFAGRHGRSSYALVPGLFYHHGDADGALDVVGPAYVKHGSQGWAAGLAPLAFFGAGQGRSHQVILPPLFVHTSDDKAQASRWLVGPYFHRRDGAETADVLFPLFYLRRAPSDSFGLWLIGGYQREHGVTTTVVGPFIRRTNDATGARTTLFFPLVGVHDSPGYSVRAVFPVFWRIHDGDETDTALFPLYFRGRSPTRRFDAVFPLFIHTKTAVASTTVLGPLWVRSRSDGGQSIGMLPLWAYGKKTFAGGKSMHYFGMPGLYVDHNDVGGTSTVWATLFYWAHKPDGYTSGFIPLVYAWRHGSVSQVAAPFFYRKHDEAKDSTFTYLLAAYYGHDGPAKKFGLFPLFYAGTHGDGTWAAGLFPLFYAKKKADGSLLASWLFGWSTSAAGKRVYVGPVYYRHEGDVTAGAFLPLIYHQRNAATGARVSFGLPLYFEDRIGDGREIAAYSPLVWRYHTVESTTLIGLPLFFDARNFGESRSTGLLPFFVRHRDQIEKSTSWMIPPILSWWRHAPGKTDYVFFPLVWRFGGKDSTTIVAPLVWRFVRGESKTTVFMPFGATWHRSDANHVLAPLVYYKKGIGPKEGMWYLNVFPFLAVGRPTPKDLEWYALEGLFGYSRKGRNRSVRLLWVLDFKLEDVPAANLSWFGSTPPSAREMF